MQCVVRSKSKFKNLARLMGFRPLSKPQGNGAWLAALAALLVGLSQHAQAQPQPLARAWPTQPVRLIVPFPAGAAPDVIARLLAERLSARWSQAVIVDNRPGAGGITGMSALVGSAADGYTLGFVPSAVLTLTPHLFKKPGFDQDKQLIPVAAVSTGPMMVVVSTSSPIATLGQLIGAARSQPGKLVFAAPQTNSVPHLAGEMLARAIGGSFLTVPYKGSPPATMAVLSGEASVTIDGLPALTEFVRAGKLRALAVTSLERAPGFENIPAVSETLPGFEAMGFFGIFAPTGTPAAVVEQVNRDLNVLLRDPQLAARFQEYGVYPRLGSIKNFNEFVLGQRAIWKTVVADLGLQPE